MIKGQWTKDRIWEDMRPFVEVAEGVKGNRRKPLAQAGGLKRTKEYGEYRANPYSGIKVDGLNATMGCYFLEDSSDPVFIMLLQRGSSKYSPRTVIPGGCPDPRVKSMDRIGEYDESQLAQALADWKAIARAAV